MKKVICKNKNCVNYDKLAERYCCGDCAIEVYNDRKLRRGMTTKEFDRASDTKGNWKNNLTRLPLTITKIHRQHFYTTAEIFMWLNEIGCKTPWMYSPEKGLKYLREELMYKTSFEIEIRHDNDYIEMGPTTDDPHGMMFHVITPLYVDVEYKPENILYVTQSLELFSEKKLLINKKLDKVSLDFFSWERKIEINDAHSSTRFGIKLTYTLKFEIRHTWR